MNRFQEAKNCIEQFITPTERECCKKDFETLQELINNYSKLEKALDKICKLLARLPDGCPDHKCIGGNCEKCWKEWALESEEKYETKI